MRIFPDTNVLVSAFATRGLCADLIELILVEHELVTGRAVLKELSRALREKLKVPPPRCEEIVDLITGEAAIVIERARPLDSRADPDDRLILGEALAAGAEVCVTGDAQLLALRAVEEMRILSPRELWEALRERAGE